MMRAILTLSALLMLAGCGSDPSGTTATKLDAVEVEPGTVSDAMIMLDDSNVDGTEVDASGGSLTPEGAAASKAEAEKAAAAAPIADTEETEGVGGVAEAKATE